MAGDMGTFRVDIEIENPVPPGVKRLLKGVLVDTGAELSWVPAEVLESLGVERNNHWQFREGRQAVPVGVVDQQPFVHDLDNSH